MPKVRENEKCVYGVPYIVILDGTLEQERVTGGPWTEGKMGRRILVQTQKRARRATTMYSSRPQDKGKVEFRGYALEEWTQGAGDVLRCDANVQTQQGPKALMNLLLTCSPEACGHGRRLSAGPLMPPWKAAAAAAAPAPALLFALNDAHPFD